MSLNRSQASFIPQHHGVADNPTRAAALWERGVTRSIISRKSSPEWSKFARNSISNMLPRRTRVVCTLTWLVDLRICPHTTVEVATINSTDSTIHLDPTHKTDIRASHRKDNNIPKEVTPASNSITEVDMARTTRMPKSKLP